MSRIIILFGGGSEIRTRASIATQGISNPPQWTNYATPPIIGNYTRYGSLNSDIIMNMDTATETPKEEESTLKTEKPVMERDLFTWVAPTRPFKRRDKQFYVTVVSIASMVCLILFIAEGAMPVILVISIIFLYYVMSTVEPSTIEYKITNKGVKVGGKRTDWMFFGRFWFSKRYDSDLLVFETGIMPYRMELVIKTEDKESIQNILKDYLVEEEISPSNIDKAIDWFSKKLPQ